MTGVDRSSLTVSSKSFRDLRVWQEAIALSKMVYNKTAGFPKEERFGLVLQLRKSAVSVASNIAEGSARSGTKEFIQFLGIARGSVAELITQIIIAHEVNFIEKSDYEPLLLQAETVSKMLSGLKGKLVQIIPKIVAAQSDRSERSTVNE